MKTTSILTTGQVAQICEVAPRTVSKWFDSGRLRGYRIPGSQDRRIPRENLVRFMREHGMPLDRVVKDDLDRVLIIGREECQIISSLAGCGLTVETAQSGFEGGMRVGANCPDCAIIDAESAGDFGAMDIALWDINCLDRASASGIELEHRSLDVR